MVRIAVLDHSSHRLYVEDISDEELEKYGGDEQAYIDDNYFFEDGYSWDYIVEAEYIPEEDKTPIDMNFEEIGDIYG